MGRGGGTPGGPRHNPCKGSTVSARYPVGHNNPSPPRASTSQPTPNLIQSTPSSGPSFPSSLSSLRQSAAAPSQPAGPLRRFSACRASPPRLTLLLSPLVTASPMPRRCLLLPPRHRCLLHVPLLYLDLDESTRR